MKKYILYALLAFCAVSQGALAQVTTQGTDFYVSWGANDNYEYIIDYISMQIRVAATQAAHITLTFSADASTDEFDVSAGDVYTYDLDATQKDNVYSEYTGTSSKSLRIQSTTPVAVYALNQAFATTDATNVLPVTNYGTDYYQVSYIGLGAATYADGYTVIATVNGTTVYEDGIPMAILDAGEVYSDYTHWDATGSHITSDHPIAYYVTGTCVNVPVGTGACDCLYQQMAPVNSWGNTFVVPVTHRGKERVRIVASQNNTQVTQTGGIKKLDGGGGAINPPNENSFTLNAGQFAEFEIALSTGGAYISADKPIAVASYLIGMDYSALTVRKGDPAEAWVPSVEQMIEGTAIAPFAPSANTELDEHHALIITPTDTRAQTTVSIGGAPDAYLTGGTWTTGNGTGSAYSFYSMPLTNTSSSYYFHNLEGLTVMGYGLGGYESYYYMSGASGRSLNPAFYINDIHYQDLDGNVVCGQTLFHVRGVAQLQLSTAPGHIKWYVDGTEVLTARDLLEWDINTLAIGTTHTFRMEVLEVIDEYNNTYLHTLSTTFTVKNQAVAATITTTGATVCSGTSTTLTGTSTGVTNPIYRWYVSQIATTPLHTGPTYTTPALTSTTTYYVSVEGDAHCENVINDRKPVTVTVSGSLSPGSIGSAQSICYNTAPQPLTEINAPGCGCGSYDYQWQSSTNDSDWSNISGAMSATYSPPALTANTYYRRAVTSGSCGTVYSESVLITVYPVVTVNAVADTTVCAGTVVPQKTFSSSTAGVTYTWTNNNTAIGLAASGTGNLPQFTAQSNSPYSITATITVTPAINGCAGTPITYNITVSPCTVIVNPHLRTRVNY
ncbi:MAG: hypothetical protein LBJ58_04590 [Tannerellaceae bacterium]|jgi:hypothetical protein|nr:hypothetical protein [Tannerellaceae bacterium]